MARISWLSLVAVWAAVFCARVALGQQTAPGYDGIQAGYDAYQRGEEQRQRNVGQQIHLNDRMRAMTTPLATYAYGYGPYASTSGTMPASREYAYAYGNSPALYYPGFGSRNAARPLTVFEPWPYVPSDIWGDFYTPPLRQSVAQAQSQTGPNRWESHPVYNPPLYSYAVLPPLNSPALDKTPYADKRSAVLTSKPVDPTSPSPPVTDKPARPHRREF